LPSLGDPFAVLEEEGEAHAGGIDHRRDHDRARRGDRLFLVSWTAKAIAEWGSFRTDRMEQKIDDIAKRLDELAGGKAPVVGR
jgi:hypothetical protein